MLLNIIVNNHNFSKNFEGEVYFMLQDRKKNPILLYCIWSLAHTLHEKMFKNSEFLKFMLVPTLPTGLQRNITGYVYMQQMD